MELHLKLAQANLNQFCSVQKGEVEIRRYTIHRLGFQKPMPAHIVVHLLTTRQ